MRKTSLIAILSAVLPVGLANAQTASGVRIVVTSEPKAGGKMSLSERQAINRQMDQLKASMAAAQAYGACVLHDLQSGTKVDLDDAVVDAAREHCRKQELAVATAMGDLLPLEERQRQHDDSRSGGKTSGWSRAQAVMMALQAYYNNDAGGQPAVSTARSK